MKIRGLFQGLAFAVLLTSTDCAWQPPQTARDVTDPVVKGTDLACVMGSMMTDSKALADFCHLADVLIPIVQRLVSVRDAARKAGVIYQPPTPADAGVDSGP